MSKSDQNDPATMDGTTPYCIWCTKPVRRASLEHILPDALGCPPEFVLRDCVCMACNNGLGHVDHALLHEFEILAFMAGVRRKGGRPPSIESWAAIRGRYGAAGPEMHLNAGPGTIEASGARLAAAAPANGITDCTIDAVAPGEVGGIHFTQQFGRHSKLVRALHKVALGSLAWFGGAAEVLQPRYDPLRTFVRTGEGEFGAIMMAGPGPQTHSFVPPARREGAPHPLIEFAVFGVSFLVDADPGQTGLLVAKTGLERTGAVGWVTLPLPSRGRKKRRTARAPVA